MTGKKSITIGRYLANRLVEAGLEDYFAIPGDYNLILLDELLKVEQLSQIYCCNELNAGYAADGYARAKGLAAAFVTYSVGGLSIVNAAAGAYAEDLPVIFVSGAPNTNAAARNRLLHHTLAKVNYRYVRDMFAEVTVDAVTVQHHDEAAAQIDHAIGQALYHSKPVYIEIACNIAAMEISVPSSPLLLPVHQSSSTALEEALDHASKLLNDATKPVLVGGSKLRSSRAIEAFHSLSTASGYATAGMAAAKGMVDETCKQYIGTYWGAVSSPACGEIVESADAYIFVGAIFNDYSTVGYNLLLKPEHTIEVNTHAVKIAGTIYNQVVMRDFLQGLAARVEKNDAALKAFHRIEGEATEPKHLAGDAAISTRYAFAKIEGMLDDKTTVVAETGDSWFNGLRLKLPRDCRFEIQMQYGSIGWSVGAALGYQVAVQGQRRVIALIGDGSFQMTAQEVSTMIRYGQSPIIFLFNNGGYTIEVEIHDGPYNKINNWNYAALVDVFNCEGQHRCLARQARTAGELDEAVAEALDFKGLCFIEVFLDKDDCNKNLLKWGSYVANANGEPPMAF